MSYQERRDWRQWHALEMPCTLMSYNFDNDCEITFQNIRELMKYVRKQYPNRDWKSTKHNYYTSTFWEIKYSRKDD